MRRLHWAALLLFLYAIVTNGWVIATTLRGFGNPLSDNHRYVAASRPTGSDVKTALDIWLRGT